MIRPAATVLSLCTACLLALFVSLVFQGDSQASSTSATNEKATRQLFQAVYANDLASARASVGTGADVDARDRWGMTPADIAIDRGNYAIAHFLVSTRNMRREQEAKAVAPASAAAAAAKSPAPSSSSAVPVESPRLVAGKKSVAVAPAGIASANQPTGQPTAERGTISAVAGPNPFDPSTPAPGSQLPGAAASR